MRMTRKLLAASAALTVAIGQPAWSAMRTPADGSPPTVTAFVDEAAQALPLIVASDNDDDDDERGDRPTSRRDHDHDVDGDDDCDDDDGCRDGVRSPAPAGPVAPPRNGLFGNGAPPQVKVN